MDGPKTWLLTSRSSETATSTALHPSLTDFSNSENDSPCIAGTTEKKAYEWLYASTTLCFTFDPMQIMALRSEIIHKTIVGHDMLVGDKLCGLVTPTLVSKKKGHAHFRLFSG